MVLHTAVKKTCLHGGGQAAKSSPTQLGSKKPKQPGSFCGQGITGAAVGWRRFLLRGLFLDGFPGEMLHVESLGLEREKAMQI